VLFITTVFREKIFFAKTAIIFKLPRAFVPVIHTFSRKFPGNLMFSKYFYKNGPFVLHVAKMLVIFPYCGKIAKMQKLYLQYKP